MAWFRIDNRLIHGQVIEAWLPYLDATHLVVVNNALSSDSLQQQIMQLAVPARVAVHFVSLEQAKPLYEHYACEGSNALFIVANCQDALALAQSGVPIATLNIGNMHYAHGKKYLCAHAAASDDDVHCLRELAEKGTVLDFRCVPGDVPLLEEW